MLNDADGNELAIMSEISKKTLVKRSELVASLGMDRDMVEAILRNLVSKGFVIPVTPAGETSYVLTQKGIKSIQNS